MWDLAKQTLEYKTWKKNSPFLYDMILRYGELPSRNLIVANDLTARLSNGLHSLPNGSLTSRNPKTRTTESTDCS